MITATRHHDFSAGHRVMGHESACAHAHGHNYRVHFTCRALSSPLDSIGRVIDFSVMKSSLCAWLESNWDHRFMLCADDSWIPQMRALDPAGLVVVPFNPTAENMARYLLNVVGPQRLLGTNVELVRVVVEETRKCSAEASLAPAYAHTHPI